MRANGQGSPRQIPASLGGLVPATRGQPELGLPAEQVVAKRVEIDPLAIRQSGAYVALRDVVQAKAGGGPRDHHAGDRRILFEPGGLVQIDAPLQLLQAAGFPREELDPANRPARIGSGPVVAHASREFRCARGPHRRTLGILVRDQQLRHLAVSGHELPSRPERFEDRYRPQRDLLRFGKHPYLPDKLRKPPQRVPLTELVTELDIAIKRPAHGVGRGFELGREKALGRPAFVQPGAQRKRNRRDGTQRTSVQGGSLAVGAKLRCPRRGRRREAQHRVVILGRVRVVGEASKIRRPGWRCRQRNEDRTMQADLAGLVDRCLKRLPGQFVPERDRPRSDCQHSPRHTLL